MTKLCKRVRVDSYHDGQRCKTEHSTQWRIAEKWQNYVDGIDMNSQGSSQGLDKYALPSTLKSVKRFVTRTLQSLRYCGFASTYVRRRKPSQIRCHRFSLHPTYTLTELRNTKSNFFRVALDIGLFYRSFQSGYPGTSRVDHVHHVKEGLGTESLLNHRHE